MKQLLYILLILITPFVTFSQPNCEIMKDDAACYKGCKTAWKAIRYKQGSYKSQKLFDKAIELCPTLAYAHQQKAVAHLKRGQFIEWKKMIDTAVELDPLEHLGYRGWCRIQFLRDYKGAIKDLEALRNMMKGDMGFCQNGNYHLEIALGLCYKEIGQIKKAKEIFVAHMESDIYYEALYDHYHLGVIEFQLENFEAAKQNLEKQIEINKISEAHYYLALIAELENNQEVFNTHIAKAEKLYRQEFSLYDGYAEPIDKIYLSDIVDKRKTEAFKK